VDEVALAEGAAGQELDGVDPAHVGLDDGHHFLVGRVGTDLGQRHLGGPDAHGQPRAHVAVELHDPPRRLRIDHGRTLPAHRRVGEWVPAAS